ncbi:TRAP transporter substrate-binding protein [Sporomusa aerivorans]|uniref:TRAP transporter substrate-binding protein n=1 Tax=Sporomusa aerivorans TaxID=204936 RepID=UPI003529F3BC
MHRLLASFMIVLAGAFVMVSGVLTGCSPAGGRGDTASGSKVILKLGTETAVGSPETRGAQKLAELVRKNSNGTLEIEVYEDAKLGTMRERNEGMRSGAIDMGTSSVGFLASYEPVAGIFDLPYLYTGKAHEMRVFDGEIGREIDRRLREHGLRVLCYFDAGTRQITNNIRPINTLNDLKGMRLRVPQSEASIEGFKILGATPTPMPFGEVYMGLNKNVVSGQENPVSLILSNNFYKVQKYLSLTNHQLFMQVLLVSEKSWRKLSAEQQAILLTASWEAEVYEREIVAREEVELLSILKEKGIQVNEVANQGEFAARAKSLQEIYIKRLGQPAKDLFEKIDALR